jgi:hypothetical protein
MKTYSILFALYFVSLTGFSQKLQLEKASPFTAIHWENQQPVVQFGGEWYTLEKLDIYTSKELLSFCKQKFGDKWQKRFSEDLIEVLKEMGSPPNEKVQLLLSNGFQQKNVTGTYSLENRQQVVAYAKTNAQGQKKLTIQQSIEDISEFERLLDQQSSYIHLTNYNYRSGINLLKKKVEKSTSEINVDYLVYEFAKIMAEIGDRHSSVKNESFEMSNYFTYSLQLPFAIAPLKWKAVAVKNIENEGISYKYYNGDFPFIKAINDLPIHLLIDSLVYKSKKAPKEAKFTNGIAAVQQIGKLYFMNNLKLPKEIKVTFTNGKTERTEIVQLQKKPSLYQSKLEQNTILNSINIKKGNFKSISTLLHGNIGLISLPEMYSFDEVNGLEKFIDSTLDAFYHTKALIIDLRFNPGGSRDLIQKFAPYIIPKLNSPWVANVAYLRTDDRNAVHSSMSDRFLFPYSSNNFNYSARKSIAVFSNSFVKEKEFDDAKFSNPHYMVLESGIKPYTIPIYILVNEHSFSAASVFTSSFKGLPNVKVVGVNTDGSSGNLKQTHLKHSNIQVGLSTMLSFQRDGKTLDGIGTKPDIYLPENEEQLFKGVDVQLKRLTEIINCTGRSSH